jgi:hypothetical protein
VQPFSTFWTRPDRAADSSNGVFPRKKELGRPFCRVRHRTHPPPFSSLRMNPPWRQVYTACREEDVEALQRLFPSPTEWRDELGRSLLRRVISTSHVRLFEWLLTFPFDVNEQPNRGYGNTLLMLACMCRQPAMARRLLDHGADLQATDSEGRTALHIACSRGWVDGVALLLQHGADPDARDDQGNLPEDFLFVSTPGYATLCTLLDEVRPGCGLK